MLEFLKRRANRTRTENGAATHATTASDCLDLFAAIGALRQAPEQEIIDRFVRAYAENPDLTMKLAFFARDVRGGLGERRVFRVVLRWLAENQAASIRKNLELLPEYGRFDDLLTLLATPCEPYALACIQARLNADCKALESGGAVSLLAKWLPSPNASRPETVRDARRVARGLGLTDAAYRKTLSRLRAHLRILENNLRLRDYSFDYQVQPATALYKYRKAFWRNDRARYRTFLDQVSTGQAKMHTGTLTPYEIIAPYFKRNILDAERRSMDVTWNAQADYTRGERALAVVDGSGSMYAAIDPRPIAVALSLGIYFAERNTGPFHNHFITFSTSPRLVEVKGRDILEKVRYCLTFNEVANTNVQRVFDLVLDTAVQHSLPQRALPSTLYFLTDMEFDACAKDAGETNFESAKARFARHGYALPKVVFWNVASRNRHQPVVWNELGVALVSGCTPRIFSLLASGLLTPYAQMMQVLGSARYAAITA